MERDLREFLGCCVVPNPAFAASVQNDTFFCVFFLFDCVPDVSVGVSKAEQGALLAD